jgi:hypothetical protein
MFFAKALSLALLAEVGGREVMGRWLVADVSALSLISSEQSQEYLVGLVPVWNALALSELNGATGVRPSPEEPVAS